MIKKVRLNVVKMTKGVRNKFKCNSLCVHEEAFQHRYISLECLQIAFHNSYARQSK